MGAKIVPIFIICLRGSRSEILALFHFRLGIWEVHMAHSHTSTGIFALKIGLTKSSLDNFQFAIYRRHRCLGDILGSLAPVTFTLLLSTFSPTFF